jgi:hypothetical protein
LETLTVNACFTSKQDEVVQASPRRRHNPSLIKMSDRGKTKGGTEAGKRGKDGGRRDPARTKGEKQLAEVEKNRLASLVLSKPPPKRPPTQPPASDRTTKDPPTPEKRGRQGLRSRDASPAFPPVDVETTQPPKKPTKTELAKAAARKLLKEEEAKAKLARRRTKALDEAEAAARVNDALAAAAAEDRAPSDEDGDESEALLDSSLYKDKDVEEEPNPKDEAEDNPPSSEGEASSDDPRDLAFKPRRGELDDSDEDDEDQDQKGEADTQMSSSHALENLVPKSNRTKPPKPARGKRTPAPRGGNKRKRRDDSPESSVPRHHASVIDAGEKATLLAHVRAAFMDMGPHLPPVMPFIYWDPEVTFSCAAKLIARSPELQKLSEAYDCKNDLAKKHAQVVRTVANNERSTQIRVMKAMWLNEDSPLSFTNYSSAFPPKVGLTEDFAVYFEPGGVDQFLELLESSDLYTNPEVYDYFCLGLESGNFKGTEARPITTISELLTPSHEAHFRAELWWNMPNQTFRHSIGRIHGKRRIAKWREFLPHVFNDRKLHEEEAHKLRVAKYESAGGRIEKDKDTHGTADNVDERFW